MKALLSCLPTIFFTAISLISTAFVSTVLISSSALAQPSMAEVIQPAMDCLNRAVPDEKVKLAPSRRGIKDACAQELKALSALPPDVHASIMSQIDAGLDRHLTDVPNVAPKRFNAN